MIRGVSQRIGRLFGRSSGVKVPVARLRLDGPIMPPQGGGGMSRGRITVPEIEKQVRSVQKMYHISRENVLGRFLGNVVTTAQLKELRRKHRWSKFKAIALSVNSPGGAAAQSALVCELLQDTQKELDIPMDVCASGGYMLACAADEIYINPFTVIGSVGVLSASFGFKQVIERWGVERRLQTAGQRKILTDPFGDWTPEGKEVTGKILVEMHDRFKEMVRESRGERLGGAYLRGEGDATAPQKSWYKSVDDLLEGDIFVGKHAVGYGFADGIGSMGPILAEKLETKQANLDIQDIRKGGFSLFSLPMGSSLGSAAGDAASARMCAWLEEQSMGKQSFH